MANEPPGLIGEVLGAYRIEREVGRGAMGVVYLATHTTIGQRAAVKVLLPQKAIDGTLVRRFFNEARAAATIRHPGLVSVFDYAVRADGSAYLVMEYLEGESLAARLQREGKLPPALALTIAGQIAAAVGAAHAHKIVHRDLKPDNIFLVPDAAVAGGVRVKVLDFGIAKLIAEDAAGMTRPGQVFGTPIYMSPEQCRGETAVDYRTDLYGLGAILYHMLCGRPPFTSAGVGALIAAHLTEAPRPPSELVPGLSSELDALVLGLLAKDPGARPASMDAFVGALDRLGGARMLGAPVRRRAAPVLAVVAAAGALSFLAFEMWRRHATVADAAPCVTNRQCAERNGGTPWLCRKSDRTCVPLLNKFCPRILADPEDVQNDATIFVGLIAPRDINGAQSELAADMARQEIRRSLGGGLPPATAGGPRRPIAIIDCNDELADVRSPARFLVEDVKIPVMIGPFQSSDTLLVAQNYAIPHQVLLLSPSANADLVTSLADDDLVYRLTLSGSAFLQALNPLIAGYVEPRLHAEGIVAAHESIRVAVVFGEHSGVYNADVVLENLRFNSGKTAAENGESFLAVNYGAGTVASEYAAAVSAVLAFKPHVTVILAPPHSFPHLFRPLEAEWPDHVPRPIHIVAPPYQNVIAAALGSHDLRRRTLILSPQYPGFNTTAYSAWVLKLRSTFPEGPLRAVGPGYASHVYDSVYLSAYAIAAAGDRPIVGPNLVAGLRQATGAGEMIRSGPEDLLRGLTRLAEGKHLAFNGLDGQVIFDENGDRFGVAGVMCVDIDDMGRAKGFLAASLTVNPVSGEVAGSLDCMR